MNQQRMNGGSGAFCNEFRNTPYMMSSDPGARMMGSGNMPHNMPHNMAPPLPPRRPMQNSYGPFGSFGSGYSGYGSFGNSWGRGYGGGYSGYGSYGYGSYPYGGSLYNNNALGGPSGDAENRLIQFAEESTRPAFQSIEAMVHTFSSVTMMLESTFFAMTSSFRAILSVAENLGRLRSMFGQLLSTFALFKFFKWLYYKAMYLLGVRNQDPSSESVWRQTLSEVLNGNKDNQTTAWPILTFLGLLFATPYLVHRLVRNASKNAINVNDPKEWFNSSEPVHSAIALYDFTAASKEELNLKTGQKILIAPRPLQPRSLPGWWRASNTVEVGLVPSNYVKVITTFKKKSDSDETKTDCEENPFPNETLKNEETNVPKNNLLESHNLENIYEENEEESISDKT